MHRRTAEMPALPQTRRLHPLSQCFPAHMQLMFAGQILARQGRSKAAVDVLGKNAERFGAERFAELPIRLPSTQTVENCRIALALELPQ